MRMKQAFFQLNEEKRAKIVESCIHEFGAYDFEKASLDRIVERAGISKGGLYEYISSKEELYLYIVDLSYGLLYKHLHGSLEKDGSNLPKDVLRRFKVVSDNAIEFYLEHPEMVGIIVNTTRILDEKLQAKIGAIYATHFTSIFDNIPADGLRYPIDQVMDLLKWILIKTRNDFLKELAATGDSAIVKDKYKKEWDFILSVLAEGIYSR